MSFKIERSVLSSYFLSFNFEYLCGIGYSKSSLNLESVIVDCNDWLDIQNGKKMNAFKHQEYKKIRYQVIIDCLTN